MNRLKKTLADESGATIVLVALSTVVMLGFAALAVDIGMIFAAKAEAQRAADSAALAGASVYLDETMPIGGADGRARDFAGRNSIMGSLINADPAAGVVGVTDAPSEQKVTVTVNTSVSTWFARVLGAETVPIGAVAAARVFNSGTVSCIKPFGIPDDTYSASSAGTDVLMWESRSQSDDEGGNAAFLLVGSTISTPGVGNDIYSMLMGEDCTEIHVGDEIPAKPGNNSLGNVKKALSDIETQYGDISYTPDGPYDGFSREDYLTHPRVGLIPTYDSSTYAGSGTDNVTITGFLTVLIHGELIDCFANKDPRCAFEGNGKRLQLYATILPATGVTDNCVGSNCASLTRVLQLVQ